MKDIIRNYFGLIAVAVFALVLCGCPHSPERQIDDCDWSSLDVGADILPNGWAKSTLSEDHPFNDKFVWWDENPKIISPASDDRSHLIFSMMRLTGKPEEAYFCAYADQRSNYLAVIGIRYATPSQAAEAYQSLLKTIRKEDLFISGRLVVQLAYFKFNQDIRGIRDKLREKWGGDSTITNKNGGVVVRGNILEITSHLGFKLLGCSDVVGGETKWVEQAPGTVRLDISKYPYWTVVVQDFTQNAILDEYIAEALERKYNGIVLPGEINDKQLQRLCTNKDLWHVGLGSGVTDSGVTHLESLPKLLKLGIANNKNITGKSLPVIGNLRSLQALSLRGCINLGGSDLMHLKNLTNLKLLNLGKIRITNETIEMIGQFGNLEVLHLSSSPGVTDDGVKQIASLKNLRVLGLWGMPDMSDQAIRHLSGLSKLNNLCLYKTNITDDALEILADMKSLRELNLIGCYKLTPAKIKWLKKQLPDCAIRH